MITAKQWREAVRRADVSPQVKLLCDYLSHDMWQNRGRYNGIPLWVSIPEPFIVEALGTTVPTLRRWFRLAIEAGVLARIRRGGNGRTAEYQGLMPKPATRPGCVESNTSHRSGISSNLIPNFPAPHRNDGKLGIRTDTLISTDHSRNPGPPTGGNVPTGPTPEWVPPETEPDDPDTEETHPEDLASGTPADHRADRAWVVAPVVEQGRAEGARAESTTRLPDAGRPVPTPTPPRTPAHNLPTPNRSATDEDDAAKDDHRRTA